MKQQKILWTEDEIKQDLTTKSYCYMVQEAK